MGWPHVELREVLRPDLVPVRVNLADTYEMVGVYSFGRGLFRREPVHGSKTSYKFFYRLKSDHFVMSQLFGWEGALALSSDEFAGLFVSPQFPTFLCDQQRLDRQFLGWAARMPSFWDDLAMRTRGMGDRRRTLNPEALLSCKIPLPPLDEQRRVVSRIEEMAAKIDQARTIRAGTSEILSSFVTSLHAKLSGARLVKVAQILSLREDRCPVRADDSYPQVGIRAYGAGLFAKPPVLGSQTTYREFNRLFDGALVLSQVKGWEGAIAVCTAEFAGLFASPEYRTFRCVNGQALPRYLAAIIATPWFRSKLATLTRGVGARRERTRPEAFLGMDILWPELRYQQRSLEVFEKLRLLQPYQSQTAAELDALMPSILSKAFRGEL
jgi:type I restriction enzyme, S subunit